MRWISAILIFSVFFTLSHDALCHEGGGETSTTWFSHPGNEHGHDFYHQADHHHHPEETDHESDHHDDDTHDHQVKPLFIKKETSTRQRIQPDQVVGVAYSISGSISLMVDPSIVHPVRYRAESFLSAYARTHSLLL